MIDTVLIGMYFLVALIGIFAGLYIGFSIIGIRRFWYRKPKKKIKKLKANIEITQKQKKKIKEKSTENNNLLSDRCSNKDSYTRFTCDFAGDNVKDHIDTTRKSQDKKYKKMTY